MFDVIRSTRIPMSILIAGMALVGLQTACAAKESELPGRPTGTLRNVEVYAPASSYAAFPCLLRTKKEMIIDFGDQSLKWLNEIGIHPHYAPVATRKYAISADGGLTWQISDLRYPLKRPLLGFHSR